MNNDPKQYACGAHPEFVKATSQLMESVTILSNNVKWIVNIGKGVFAVGIALIVVIIMGIYNAGIVSDRVSSMGDRLTHLEQELKLHVYKKDAHHEPYKAVLQ